MPDLWSQKRWASRDDAEPKGAARKKLLADLAVRSRFQQDYDRLLFSTPVRRLSDKTQVWPMDENDGVRTRLTHSHEVANLARSIGTRIHSADPTLFGGADLHNVVQPMLSAIGLAHDLGNPPFGHQGEAAIARWFNDNGNWIFTHTDRDAKEELKDPIPLAYRKEFLSFDGNPQTIRLLAKLQTSISHSGLDLTAATLAATIKYPVGAPNQDDKIPTSKKHGYFLSEQELVDWVRSETGLTEKQRHPLTWIMEACDDIAYSVLDVDDAMKKGVISPDDVMAILAADDRTMAHHVVKRALDAFSRVVAAKRRPEIARDIKIGYLRAFFIDALIDEASAAFVRNGLAISDFSHREPLMETNPLCDTLKGIARQYAFGHPTVLKMEALGAEAVNGLMTAFWNAIHDRKSEDFAKLDGKRRGAKNKFVFALISQNYLDDAVNCKTPGLAGSIRYRELRLMTDMLAGMTDTFTIKLWNDVKSLV
ncbi:deoxyguanosinetriphosphate triphosphohydrolase family protein [Sphingomonas albertensis]|uniref:deoxyguanosinetriphosphate triphosphohydrolase family protein n=1 Tax=Sphingomonas albertensis TaxID=2762591 RepID=UPI001BE42C32|nr:dNTP triphosphohydrolase [Sphingomonas albertensis]